MSKIITIVLSVIFLASCSLEGTWNVKSVTAQGCYSGTNCVGYLSVPGKINGCDASIEGTLTFSGRTKGTLNQDITVTAKCPGEKASTVRFLQENIKYRTYKEKGKAYIYYYEYNVVRQFILGEDNLTLMCVTKAELYIVYYFTARGLKPPKYMLTRFNYTRQEEESNGPASILGDRLR